VVNHQFKKSIVKLIVNNKKSKQVDAVFNDKLKSNDSFGLGTVHEASGPAEASQDGSQTNRYEESKQAIVEFINPLKNSVEVK